MVGLPVKPARRTWPKRPLVCVDCRTTLLPGEACAQPEHTVVSLANVTGRQVLNATAWDASGIHHKRAARARGIDVPTPTSAGRSFVGWVIAEDSLVEPFTDKACAAFCVQLELMKPPGEITLRDAPTLGFRVRADDGRELVIERGRLDMRLFPRDKRYVNHAFGLADYMTSLDPARSFDQPLDPLPYDRVALAIVRDGDRVAVHNARAVPEPGGVQTGYRESPPTVMRISGVPVVTLVR